MRHPWGVNATREEQANAMPVALPESPARILIVKLTSVGDVLHACPSVSAVRRRFPQAHLAWLVDYRMADVVALNPDVDQVIVLGRASADGSFETPTITQHLRALAEVRAGRFDLVVDMQGLLKSALFTRLSGARVRIGFGNGRIGNRWAINVGVPPLGPGTHATVSYCEFAKALGTEASPHEFRLRVPEEHAHTAERLLCEGDNLSDRPLAAIVPGSAWPSKRWPTEHFARLATLLAREDEMQIIVLGHRGDAEAADAIVSGCEGDAVSLAGRTTLGQAIALAAKCRLVVGGDTGLVQVAAALGVPTVAVYGPTDPTLTGPVGPRVRIVQNEVDCWPCRERECDHWECMRELEAETVYQAALELMGT